MEKAMKREHMRDDSITKGNLSIPKYSIVNIPKSDIIHRAECLGVSLGKTEIEVVNYIKGIKRLDEERIFYL
jgi:hypothetical protein